MYLYGCRLPSVQQEAHTQGRESYQWRQQNKLLEMTALENDHSMINGLIVYKLIQLREKDKVIMHVHGSTTGSLLIHIVEKHTHTAGRKRQNKAESVSYTSLSKTSSASLIDTYTVCLCSEHPELPLA